MFPSAISGTSPRRNVCALEFIEEAYKSGVTWLFIDEVHHVQRWQTVIKNFGDFYPLSSRTPWRSARAAAFRFGFSMRGRRSMA